MLYCTQILQFSTMQNAVTGQKKSGLGQSHPSISQSAGRLHLLFFRLFNKHDPALARSFVTFQWQQRQHGSLHLAARHMTFSFLDTNYCPKPTCFLFPPKTEVIKRCFGFACKQWIGTYSTKIQIWRFTAQKWSQAVSPYCCQEGSWSKCGGLGKATPYCFFYIHFNSLEDEWTSFQNTS